MPFAGLYLSNWWVAVLTFYIFHWPASASKDFSPEHGLRLWARFSLLHPRLLSCWGTMWALKIPGCSASWETKRGWGVLPNGPWDSPISALMLSINSISKMRILPVDPDGLGCQSAIFIIFDGNSIFSAGSSHLLVEISFCLQESLEWKSPELPPLCSPTQLVLDTAPGVCTKPPSLPLG